MKNNLFNPATQQAIIERIQKLTPDHPRQWGKMTPNETLCHMADPFRDVLNLRQTKPAVWPIVRPLIRMMVLTEKDWKPNTPTLPVYRQGAGGAGTPPTDFESDKATLIGFINQFCATSSDFQFGPHPGVGRLNREMNGFMMWKHTDHHLREFGL
ncbi:MAG: DUF1569 domain-containing protein [Saprospiraceae bacterium]